MSVYDWSVTAANNDNADANINWTEGQAANSVNNSARAQMAAFAAFLQQINGAGTSAGSGNNYTFTSPAGNALAAYGAGNMICFKANHSNTNAATLNVDGRGAKSLKKFGSVDVVANDIEINNLILAIYDGTNFQVMSQVSDNNIQAFSTLVAATNKLPYFDSASSMAISDFSPLAQNLLADATTGAMQSTLGLAPGTNVQAFDADLSSIAGLAATANTIPFKVSGTTWSHFVSTSLGRNLVGDATATDMRSTIGVPENTRKITFGTAAPGTLGTGEIYLRHG